jgi:hypothetical protein
LEGLLSYEEIGFYHNNANVFFLGEEQYIADIKDFYGKIEKNIRKKISNDYVNTLSSDEVLKWSYLSCFHAQISGLHVGYNSVADHKMDLLDFYFLNSEGNFEDLKTFMNINKMDIKDVSQFY